MPTSIGRISDLPLSSEARRPRTAPRQPSAAGSFQEVLRTGAQVLLAGASAASGLVGGPMLSSAIDAARSRLSTGNGSEAGSGGAAQGGASGPLANAVQGSSGGGGAGGGSGSSEVEAMRQLQQEGRKQSLQYLQLQQEVQQMNRRFTVASNLLKAKHDTARSAINNLRS